MNRIPRNLLLGRNISCTLICNHIKCIQVDQKCPWWCHRARGLQASIKIKLWCKNSNSNSKWARWTRWWVWCLWTRWLVLLNHRFHNLNSPTQAPAPQLPKTSCSNSKTSSKCKWLNNSTFTNICNRCSFNKCNSSKSKPKVSLPKVLPSPSPSSPQPPIPILPPFFQISNKSLQAEMLLQALRAGRAAGAEEREGARGEARSWFNEGGDG